VGGKNIMQLLTGADISIRFDPEKGRYIARVTVGYTHQEAIADDPVKALGLAVMLKAGYTENKLKKELIIQ
jgi:hypothetical protein